MIKPSNPKGIEATKSPQKTAAKERIVSGHRISQESYSDGFEVESEEETLNDITINDATLKETVKFELPKKLHHGLPKLPPTPCAKSRPNSGTNNSNGNPVPSDQEKYMVVSSRSDIIVQREGRVPTLPDMQFENQIVAKTAVDSHTTDRSEPSSNLAVDVTIPSSILTENTEIDDNIKDQEKVDDEALKLDSTSAFVGHTDVVSSSPASPEDMVVRSFWRIIFG